MPTLIPFQYKLIGALAVLAVSCAGSYFAGWNSQHTVLVAYQSRVAQAGADQAAHARQLDADHATQTAAVSDAYSGDVARLRLALDRLRKQSGDRGRVMPQAALRAEGIDAAPAEFGSTCTDAFYTAGLNDALTLKHWQEWAMREGVTVSGE